MSTYPAPVIFCSIGALALLAVILLLAWLLTGTSQDGGQS